MPLILLRSYFYSKLIPMQAGMSPPKTFKDYVGQFVSYDVLRSDEGGDEIREYLCNKFGMEFEASEEMEKSVDPAELADLAGAIMEVRTQRVNQELLARNDALQVLRIYSRRREMGERPGSNPFGFSTWWLTQESQVLRATGHLTGRYGARFLVPPEFLINFIGITPSLEAVRKSFSDIFPTLLGVRLSSRMKEGDFKKIIAEANTALTMDEARANVVLSKLSDKIKSDRTRAYDVGYEDQTISG